MGNIQQIDGTNDLYEIKKMKLMYEIGYTDSFAYIRNKDTCEAKVKIFDERKRIRNKRM